MRSSTLKWIMLCSSIIIALILISQLYWLKRVYYLEDQQFNSSIVKSIRGLFEDLEIDDDPGFRIKEMIEATDPNTYLIRLDAAPDMDSLQLYLSNEFEVFNVWTDCNVGLYSSQTNTILNQYYLPTAASRFQEPSKTSLKAIKKNYNYLLLNFPHRSNYIIHEMLFWIVTAVALLLVLIGLTISLLFLYRQKFLNELQKDFVNNFTHEFKTPLAVMKIASDVLVQPDIATRPERLKKYGEVIKEQTEHLQSQVERLLRTALTESNRLPVAKEACQLNQLIYSTIEQIDPLIKNNEATINFVPDDNEPVIFADKVHLQLVIINLIENAIKYSNLKPLVWIALQDANNGMYAITVKDNGIGIAAKNIKNLFKKFYRVPTGNIHNVNGFGLGLNFVKKIIDAHDGKIIINSVEGIGTEFKILLPKK
jgi:two-component system, OmpR family, phosphate regulon sensor histidine kinase PhoR